MTMKAMAAGRKLVRTIGLASFEGRDKMRLVHNEIQVVSSEEEARQRAGTATRKAIAAMALLEHPRPLLRFKDTEFWVQVEVVLLGTLVPAAVELLDASASVFEFLAEKSRKYNETDPEFDDEHLE